MLTTGTTTFAAVWLGRNDRPIYSADSTTFVTLAHINCRFDVISLMLFILMPYSKFSSTMLAMLLSYTYCLSDEYAIAVWVR